jgi:hypothetical protein
VFARGRGEGERGELRRRVIARGRGSTGRGRLRERERRGPVSASGVFARGRGEGERGELRRRVIARGRGSTGRAREGGRGEGVGVGGVRERESSTMAKYI